MSSISPGLHPNFEMHHYDEQEANILNKLKNDFLLTYSSKVLAISNSKYSYALIKPTSSFTEAFNIDREIICVMSPFDDFQPRVLDVFDLIHNRLPDLRTESVCKVLISKDKNIESKINNLLKNDPEQPIVIPFSYDEIIYNYNEYLVRNRFRKHFYSRDLFSFLSPLKKDLYFFGRSELIQQIINRHKSGEHTGLFGLRKSGKTSIIYAVERTLQASGDYFISIDCESPSIHKLRWNELLEKIIFEFNAKVCSNIKINTAGRYEEKNAADSFAVDVRRIYEAGKNKPTLFIFDEIERISPETGSSKHWRDECDFIYFWQTLRGYYQRNPEILTYMLVGTNPNCVEKSIICDQENPIFGSVPSQYVPPFTVDQVRQMVRKLGRYMGIKFDELVYSKLTEDFGGHPFLIRRVCSLINQKSTSERPVLVDKALYLKIVKEFSVTETAYLEMILEVLKKWYTDEYDMLCFLALDDIDDFERLSIENNEFTRHLIGYGIIQYSENGYSFRIESIKDYLQKLHKFNKNKLTIEDKISEISTRRNKIEKKLRQIIKLSLKLKHGVVVALEKSMASIPENRRNKLNGKSLDELLSKDISPLFFLELINIIDRNWDAFTHIFGSEKDKTIYVLKEINEYGRPDCHAKGITDDDFNQVRLHFKKMEKVFDDLDQ